MTTLCTRSVWFKNVASATVPERLTQFLFTSMKCGTYSGWATHHQKEPDPHTVTVLTPVRHRLKDGDKLVISGATPPGYDGDHVVKVLTPVAFKFTTTIPLEVESGTATMYVHLEFIGQATLQSKKRAQVYNTGTVYLGLEPEDASQSFDIPSGGESYLEVPNDEKSMDLADWYLDVANAGDGLIIYFNKP